MLSPFLIPDSVVRPTTPSPLYRKQMCHCSTSKFSPLLVKNYMINITPLQSHQQLWSSYPCSTNAELLITKSLLCANKPQVLLKLAMASLKASLSDVIVLHIHYFIISFGKSFWSCSDFKSVQPNGTFYYDWWWILCCDIIERVLLRPNMWKPLDSHWLESLKKRSHLGTNHQAKTQVA